MEFAKTNDKLVVISAAPWVRPPDADGVKALATLPSLDELRASWWA
jgi:large subunit ribosomal protein L10